MPHAPSAPCTIPRRCRCSLLGALALLALSGCGDPPEPDFASGSRLKATYWSIDGTKVFERFRDTLRGEDCSFAIPRPRGADGRGVTYCLPPGQHIIGYRDAGCTQPVAGVTAPGTGDAVAIAAGDTCEAFPEVRALGAAITSFERFDLDVDDHCVPMGAATAPPGETWRPVGDTIPLDDFVRAEERIEDVSDRIARVVLVSDDGARLPTAGWDATREETVVEGGPPTASGQTRWLPRGIAYDFGSGANAHAASLYADAACTEAVATKYADSAACPIDAVYGFIPVSCNQYDYRMLEAGDTLAAGSSLFAFDASGACIGVGAAGTDTRFIRETKEIPLAEFETSQRVPRGTGGVTQAYVAAADGLPIYPVDALTVRATGEACTVQRAEDGETRCLPYDTIELVYSDPACTEAIAESFNFTSCDGTLTVTPVPAALTTPADSPADAVRAWSRGDEITPATIYRRDTAACTSSTADPARRYYRLVKRAPADFPLATELTDP
jgi:hypothetical protein